MITLLKIGGSLITDKNQQSTFRKNVMARVASEIKEALVVKNNLKLIIGHGSGSFGHFEAKLYNTIAGVRTADEWIGFAKVATVAAELNYLVAKEFQNVDIPVIRFQPSASINADDGTIADMNIAGILTAIEKKLVPLVYGDVAFDAVRGGTIVSTETIFAYLVSHLPVSHIILLGEVDGVYDERENIIPEITHDNFYQYKTALEGSGGVDVTGGMLTKVNDMLQLVMKKQNLIIQIINGKTQGIVRDVLLDKKVIGTTIRG